MAKTRKPTQSEIDGVQYRRAKLWQIILYACNALCGLTVYSLIGQASYAASIGFGITTMAVGVAMGMIISTPFSIIWLAMVVMVDWSACAL